MPRSPRKRQQSVNVEGLLEKEIRMREQHRAPPDHKYRKRRLPELTAAERKEIVDSYLIDLRQRARCILD